MQNIKLNFAKVRMTCPDCGNSIITTFSPGMLWERCPSCRMHVWDEHDTLMAETYNPSKKSEMTRNMREEH